MSGKSADWSPRTRYSASLKLNFSGIRKLKSLRFTKSRYGGKALPAASASAPGFCSASAKETSNRRSSTAV